MKQWFRNTGRYVGYTLLWVLVAIVVVWGAMSARAHRKAQLITELNIGVERSSEHQLVDAPMMNDWLLSHTESPVGRPLSEVNLAELERVALQHSAVAEANAYSTFSGSVEISVAQHEPVARLKVDGYDMYLTADGYLFPASDGYAAHVPVITGSYRPIFRPNYAGYAATVVRDSIASLDSVIMALEQQKLPHHKLRQEYRQDLRRVVNERIRRTLFMSEYEYDKRNEELKERKARARKENVARNKSIDAAIRALDAEQDVVRERQKRLEVIDYDFERLLYFIERVRQSEFWSSEVVQIVLEGGGTKPMEIAFVPRSGRFLVDMGFTDRLGDKLSMLRRFYDDGLDNIGWSKYRRISLRYEGQVVCR
ncbi:MAG: hypothetical protein IKL43_05235 [Alistipes sp.]|nr:hypothetical protein [Alistipes sp.]